MYPRFIGSRQKHFFSYSNLPKKCKNESRLLHILHHSSCQHTGIFKYEREAAIRDLYAHIPTFAMTPRSPNAFKYRNPSSNPWFSLGNALEQMRQALLSQKNTSNVEKGARLYGRHTEWSKAALYPMPTVLSDFLWNTLIIPIFSENFLCKSCLLYSYHRWLFYVDVSSTFEFWFHHHQHKEMDRVFYWWEIGSFFRPYFMRKTQKTISTSIFVVFSSHPGRYAPRITHERIEEEHIQFRNFCAASRQSKPISEADGFDILAVTCRQKPNNPPSIKIQN